MVYFTGDIHGAIDSIDQFNRKAHPTKDDVIVLLGDVGVREFSRFVSEECLNVLIEIALERQSDSTNSLWVELVATLKGALETVIKKE